MFDIGADEFLLIAVVAIVVIGPKDLPRALRMAGQWIAKVRRISGHFRSGIDAMIREAELAEMEKKWREQNDEIMKAHPPEPSGPAEASAEAALPAPAPVDSTLPAPAPVDPAPTAQPAPEKQAQPEPQLPLPPP